MPVEPGERVLAHASLTGGEGVVAGTREALYVASPTDSHITVPASQSANVQIGFEYSGGGLVVRKNLTFDHTA